MYIIILQRIVVSKYTVVDARSCEANTTTLKVDNTYACMYDQEKNLGTSTTMLASPFSHSWRS